MEICILDSGQFIERPELLEPLYAFGKVRVFSGMPGTEDEIAARARDAEVVAWSMTKLSNRVLDRLPKLKLLQFIGTGLWNFADVDYAHARGIRTRNIEAYGSNAVAEFAIGLTMALQRGIVPAVNRVKARRWDLDGLRGREIAGSTVGVIGTGSIGSLVAQKFIGLGARVIANDIRENPELREAYGLEYVPVEELFLRSDVITIHMKATRDNRRFVSERLLRLMKPEAVLINVSRAELVDCEALCRALSEGRIGGAAVDVYEDEPLSDSDYRLVQLPNVIGTPHIGFYTGESNENAVRLAVASIVSALESGA